MYHSLSVTTWKANTRSATWVGPWLPVVKKLRFEKLRNKNMLVTFFDSHGLFHKEFVPTEQTVNANFYKDVLDRLIKRINLVCPDLRTSGD